MKGQVRQAGLFRALGHPVRLAILRILVAEGDACVCHLEARLDLRQAYLSQQLARLRQAGLVVVRREGLNVFYRPASPVIKRLMEAADRLDAMLAGTGADWQRPEPVEGQRRRPCPCPRCQQAEASAVTSAAVER